MRVTVRSPFAYRHKLLPVGIMNDVRTQPISKLFRVLANLEQMVHAPRLLQETIFLAQGRGAAAPITEQCVPES